MPTLALKVWRVLGESLVFVLDCKVEGAGFQDGSNGHRVDALTIETGKQTGKAKGFTAAAYSEGGSSHSNCPKQENLPKRLSLG